MPFRRVDAKQLSPRARYGRDLISDDTALGIPVNSGGVRSADFYFGTPTDPGLRFTLAPDGKSFLGTIVRTHTDLWILDGFASRGGVLDWLRRPRSQ